MLLHSIDHFHRCSRLQDTLGFLIGLRSSLKVCDSFLESCAEGSVKEGEDARDIGGAILEVRPTMIGFFHNPMFLGRLRGSIEQVSIVWIDNAILPTVDQ